MKQKKKVAPQEDRTSPVGLPADTLLIPNHARELEYVLNGLSIAGITQSREVWYGEKQAIAVFHRPALAY